MTDPPEDLEPTRSSGDIPTGPTTPVPATIGGYRILRKIGEGGMGVVYEAEQQHPKRTVAIKVVRGGRFVDEQQVRMFKREADSLARLKHPGIGAIHESGCTEDGQHFFAMELVAGETLAGYMKRRPGTVTREELRLRLALVRRIADVVQYAHQRGVIHRDLKPSNIIVNDKATRESSSLDVSGVRLPEIKILDFGLARITEGDVAAATMTAEAGMIKGTLAYMSPEQARGDAGSIDLRTDVYALGVILYEMLAGSRPYDVKKESLAGSVRVICEATPKPLEPPPGGQRRLDADVKTIVGKAMAKEADRRYTSAAALAEDIERYLTSQPILARAPSTTYQIKKLISRNKLPTVFAAVLLLALIGFGIGMSLLYRRSETHLTRALDAESSATMEAETATQVSEFLVGLFEVSDPSESRGNEITARELLDQGSEQISSELQDQPLVRARMLDTLGRVYFSLWLDEQARPLLEEALQVRREELGDEHPVVAESLARLGHLLHRTSDYQAARSYFEQALRIQEDTHGPDHPAVAESLVSLAKTLSILGEMERVPELCTRALDINERVLSAEYAGETSSMSWLSQRVWRSAEALRLLERDLAIRERALGPDHPVVAESVRTLGDYLVKTGEPERGLQLLEQALAIEKRVHGPDHPQTLAATIYLAWGLMRNRELEEALLMAEGLLSSAEKVYGADSQLMGQSELLVGAIVLMQDDLPRARRHFERSVEILEARPGHEMMLANGLSALGRVLVRTNEPERARELLERSVAVTERAYGPNHVYTATILAGYASGLREMGDPRAARPHLERALAIRLLGSSPDDPQLEGWIRDLADVYEAIGDRDALAKLYREQSSRLEKADSPDLAEPDRIGRQ